MPLKRSYPSLPHPSLVHPQVLATPLTQTTVVFKPNALAPGATYVFQYRVGDAFGNAYANVTVPVACAALRRRPVTQSAPAAADGAHAIPDPIALRTVPLTYHSYPKSLFMPNPLLALLNVL